MFSPEIFLTTALAVSFMAFFLAPLFFNRHELSPGKDQNKCTKRTDPANDPRCVPRPSDTLKIIRVTNSGEFVDRCELTDALYELNWDRPVPAKSFGARVKEDAKKLPKLTILYVHGWKHDANPEDTDLKQFSDLIRDLRDQYANQKYVVGVYLGWNATAGLPGVLENLSFWVKKNNADRIAQSSVVTKIVSSIGSVTRSAPAGQDQFIAIGHSFGARILFSATAQSLVYETERAHPGFPNGEYKLVEGSADAVILLNPAFEASRYTAIDDISRKDERFNIAQPPLLISISTENDLATKQAFPIGQWLGLARSKRELTTLGNYTPYCTHSLAPEIGGCDAVAAGNLESLTEDFCAGGLRLTRLPREQVRRVVHAHNPFLVAQTTRAIIDGHNGIWGKEFKTWLEALIVELERRNVNKKSPAPDCAHDPAHENGCTRR